MRDGDFSMNAEFDEMRKMKQEQASGSCPAPCSAPPTAQCGREMWDLFLKHDLNYAQAINVMVAVTAMIGRKSEGSPVGAYCMFLHKALELCPELFEVTLERATPREPNEWR